MSRIVPSQVVAYILDTIPESEWESLGPASIGKLGGLVTLIDKIPDELLSMESTIYSNFVLAVSIIEEQLTIWRRDPLNTTRLLDSPHGSPVRVVRDSLVKCKDEAPASSTADLPFITDDDLRQSLRTDIEVISRTLRNGDWKAATMLGGSVIEALLLWGLQNKCLGSEIENAAAALTVTKVFNQNPSNSSLDFWNLHNYIEVAAYLKIISDETADQTRLAKQFRNLIHPGRVQRLAQKCDRATAYSAVAGMEHVIRDLTRI
jgi:hypothetical protein